MRSTKLIPYIRQSRKREKTISLDEQRRWINDFPNVKLTDEVVEQGVSGSKHWRKRELGKAIEACERGEAGGIIVAWQDRLSRENGLATAEVWEALERAGARLVCAAEGLDTLAGDHEMMFAIKAAIARDQWKRYRDRFESAKRNAVERGLHVGPAPFGYVRTESGRPLTLHPRNAKAVKAAFELRASGASYGEVVGLLDRRAPGGPSGGGVWNRNTVTRLLRNRAYVGEARGGDKHVHPGAHSAIVDAQTFDVVQALAGRHEPPPSSAARSLLAGVVRCASCGHALERNTVGGGYLVYRCRGRSASGLCEAPASAMLPALDELVDSVVLERLSREAVERTEVTGDVAEIHMRIETARRKREPFEDPDYVAALGKDAALRALRKIDDELAVFDAELAEAVGDRHGAEPLVLPTVELWQTLSLDEKREVLVEMLEAVVVSRGAQGRPARQPRRLLLDGRRPAVRSPVAGQAQERDGTRSRGSGGVAPRTARPCRRGRRGRRSFALLWRPIGHAVCDPSTSTSKMSI